MKTVYQYENKNEQKRAMHVHKCILANKENKFSYELALLEGLENHTITRKCT